VEESGDKYVVWDGVDERPYIEDNGHDCFVTVDMEFVSVQKRRQEMLATGRIVPTVVFSCKGGQPAYEAEINGKWGSVFTHYWNIVLRNDPEVTFRDAIRRTNIAIQSDGFEQQGEVICRIDVLDMPVDISLPDKAHFLIYSDMCRTKWEGCKKIIY
jgi:hypothetical protein